MYDLETWKISYFEGGNGHEWVSGLQQLKEVEDAQENAMFYPAP